jgi:hypothetical protein
MIAASICLMDDMHCAPINPAPNTSSLVKQTKTGFFEFRVGLRAIAACTKLIKVTFLLQASES